jgi:hypothetical protein
MLRWSTTFKEIALASPLRDPKEDVIKSGALRLTWVSGAVGGIAGLVTIFNEEFTHLFGEHASDGIKASVLIAVIAAWAVIAVADIFARAITTSARLKKPAAAAITAPKGIRVTLTEGKDSNGWSVAAIRGFDGADGDEAEFLVVKGGEQPQWVKQGAFVLAG